MSRVMPLLSIFLYSFPFTVTFAELRALKVFPFDLTLMSCSLTPSVLLITMPSLALFTSRSVIVMFFTGISGSPLK